jgi:hypothetical protein
MAVLFIPPKKNVVAGVAAQDDVIDCAGIVYAGLLAMQKSASE